MKFYLALWLGKIINLLIRMIDKSRGSNLSGEKAIVVDPQMIKKFKGVDCSRMLFITGTNGKSTTNNLVYHIFRENGYDVVSNLEGANLMHYNSQTGCYEASLMLKQGAYNYQYLWVPDGSQVGKADEMEGNYYQTVNEYQILVYNRKRGERYDRLIGYNIIYSGI